MDSKKLVTILTVLGITMIVIGVSIDLKNRIDEKRCNNLPLNVFFQDKRCRKIYESRINKNG